MKLAVFWGLSFVGTSLMAAENYARPDLLIQPTELATVAGQFVILDARDHVKYEQGHIPAARWVDHATWAKSFQDGQDTESWSKRIAGLGIDADSKVVVYDDDWSKEAARIWSILRYWGVSDVRLLNGGWHAWTEAALPVEPEAPQPPAPTMFVAKPQAERLATKQKLLDSLKDNSLQIIDARSEGEFCGTEKSNNKRAGAIPGAKHLEWIDLLDKKSQRFKSAGEIAKLFADAGIDLNEKTAARCQSGGRASVMAFGLELMGAKDVSNYYHSWSEWGNASDTPIVPGKPRHQGQENH
jgi:thiosulfate/3-mercaptopyruvate sulfurtransferase